MPFSYEIVNVVTSGMVQEIAALPDGRVDLVKLAAMDVAMEYNPERFPGIVIRLDNPKCAVLFFSTGRLVMTGLRHLADLPIALTNFRNRIETFMRKIYHVTDLHVENNVVNIVSCITSGKSVDLNMAGVVLEGSMYEPEIFPGMIYRIPKKEGIVPAVYLVFSTGKIISTKCHTDAEVKQSAEQVVDALQNADLLRDSVAFEEEEDSEEMIFK